MKHLLSIKSFHIILLVIPIFLGGYHPLPVQAQESIIDIVNKSRSSIVTIITETAGIFRSPKTTAALDKKSGRIVFLNKMKTAYYKRVGAGVIIDAKGFIITNAHIVDNAGRITIKFFDGTSVEGKVLSIRPNDDFALLAINPPFALQEIILANSDNIKLRDEVITIGNSKLLKQTISGGHVIGLGNKHSDKNSRKDLIQTDISLYQGDSGGPLLNKNGELIGLMVAGQRHKNRSSFAISSNKIKDLYAQYLQKVKNK